MQNGKTLIIGGGLAGLTLALAMRRAGASCLVVDDADPASASRVAAGIMHPVTGRRIVRSWMADTLIPFARDFYRSVERESGLSFYHDMPILEVYDSPGQRNDWLARSVETGYGQYIRDELPPQSMEGMVRMPHGGVQVRAGFIETKGFLAAAGKLTGGVTRKHVGPGAIREGETIRWNGLEFDKVIYCTGHHITRHPDLKKLPFLPAHGEVLTIRCDGLSPGHIYNKGMFILPAGNGVFRAGATYAWGVTVPGPTTKGLERIRSFLDGILDLPYAILGHEAGIRPAIEGRRPVAGMLPGNPRVGIFNGLGAKGAMLAPYFADQLASHLVHHTPLDREVDVRRFF